MDERKLTAWLIMEGFLTPSQVKEALEDQLRLKRDGAELDIIEVARRKDLITDVQVLEVLEKTGYKPPKPVEGAKKVSLAPPSAPSESEIGSTASQSEISSLVDIPAKYMEEAIPAEFAVGTKAKPTDSAARRQPGRDSAVRRKGGSAAQAAAAGARRRQNDATTKLLVVGAFLLPIGIAILLLAGGGSDDGNDAADTKKKKSRVSQKTAKSSEAIAAELIELRGLLEKLAETSIYSPGRQDQIAQAESIVSDLKGEKLTASQKEDLELAELRLKGLSRKPSDRGPALPPPLSEDEAKAKAEVHWAELAQNFERILWLSLQQRRSPFQLGAEAVRGMDLRKSTTSVIKDYAARGPDGIAELVSAPDLHPALGVGGYSALLREAERFPYELRTAKRWQRWKKIIPRFRELRDLARAYDSAMRAAEEAAEQGDLQGAVAAFRDEKYSKDLWFTAVRTFLSQPEVVTAFNKRKKEVASGGVVVRRRIPVPRRGTGARTSGEWDQDWRERFKALAKDWRVAKDDQEKATATGGLEGVLGETLALARGSFKACREIVTFYDNQKRKKVFKAEPKLKPLLKQHHDLYFEQAFAAASGPSSFRDLDRWCSGHGYEAWRAKLRPFLRLVASAGSKKARAREAQRLARGQAKESVQKFANKRMATLTKGLEGVLGWMRRRGYAPEPAKKEMAALITRAVERAGDPVAAGRLQNDLGAIADKGVDETKKFRKQVDTVINTVVTKTIRAVNTAINHREYGLAFDLFQYLLLLDPENDKAHKALGHKKVDGKWMRKYLAERYVQGFEWDKQLGWIKRKDKARYEKGEYFDLQTNQWTTPTDASRVHADAANPWIVKTEHFELRSTADLPMTTRVAERLEAFYLQLFRQYDLFFTGKGKAHDAKLIFGIVKSQTKPLVVNFYRDRAQFQQHANPPTQWAAGFYSGGQHASFFYASGGWTTLQHEIVHQILGETSPGHANAWLAEGAAVYLENAFFRDNMLTLGTRRNHRRIVAYQMNEQSNGKEHKLLDMLKFRTGADWDSGDISKNYRGAGAVVYFLCNFDEGRYRSDFVEYLKAAYYGQNPKLQDFFGMPPEVLDALMQRFYNPKAKVQLPGGGSVSEEDLTAAVDALSKTCRGKAPDLDQLSLAYTELRKALRGAEGKEASKARNKAGSAVLSMRRRMAQKIEKAIKSSSTPKELAARWEKLGKLRAEALRVIFDTSIYPDANHGAAGQPTVDEKVNALKAFWKGLPPVFEDPALAVQVEVLRVTEPWLDELAPKKKKRDKTLAKLKQELRQRSGLENLLPSADAKKAREYDEKVRAWNAAQTHVPPDAREQVKVLNDYRIMLGRHALAIDSRLYRCAEKHSAWMERAGNMSHDEPDPARRTPTLRAKIEGYDKGVSENVAFGYTSAEAVHHGWYTSSGHHRNMTGARIFQVGVARAGTYWTQVFGFGKPSL